MCDTITGFFTRQGKRREKKKGKVLGGLDDVEDIVLLPISCWRMEMKMNQITLGKKGRLLGQLQVVN